MGWKKKCPLCGRVAEQMVTGVMTVVMMIVVVVYVVVILVMATQPSMVLAVCVAGVFGNRVLVAVAPSQTTSFSLIVFCFVCFLVVSAIVARPR